MGGAVVTFGGLFGEVARSLELPWGSGATRAQAVWIAREAARGVGLAVLRRSAQRPGFAPALADLQEEMQSANVDAATFAHLAEAGGEYERELAALFAERERLTGAIGIADRHAQTREITAGLRTAGDSWSQRPVVIYGFDELTAEQLEMVGALAAVTEVTVAVTYEDRTALAARAKLLGELRDLVPPDLITSESELDADPATTPNDTLWHARARVP